MPLPVVEKKEIVQTNPNIRVQVIRLPKEEKKEEIFKEETMETKRDDSKDEIKESTYSTTSNETFNYREIYNKQKYFENFKVKNNILEFF
jgi:hypothetical protein